MIIPAQVLRQVRPVHPFEDLQMTRNGMSYGCGAASYDIRCKQELWLWPGRFTLASTVEHFRMPTHLLGLVCDKSSWVRRGISVHNTVIDPGWFGFLTLEIKNVGWSFQRIRAGDPIAQVVFCQLTAPTDRPYRGKYLAQADEPVPMRSDTE